MVRVLTIVVALATIVASEATASGPVQLSVQSAQEMVRSFLKMLAKPTPTLSDFMKWSGQNSEEEDAFAYQHCEQQGWIPPQSNDRCSAYDKARYTRAKTEASLYLRWLKTKLPSASQVTIAHIEHVTEPQEFAHDLIYARLDDVEVVFVHPFGPMQLPERAGRLYAIKINGARVPELIKKDLAAR